jgi:hypothetical protein
MPAKAAPRAGKASADAALDPRFLGFSPSLSFMPGLVPGIHENGEH